MNHKLLLIMAFSFLSLFARGQNETFASLSVEAFSDTISNPQVQRLDVRRIDEYTSGHIPGSLNIDVQGEGFEAHADILLDKSRPVALYCRSGGRSKKAARILAAKGYKVYELDKGFLGWQGAGEEVEE